MHFEFPHLRRRRNAGVWLSIFLVVATVIAALAVASWSGAQARGRTSMALTTNAEQVAARLDRGMYERYREFQLLSLRPTLADPAVPVEDKQRLLDQVKQSHGAYAWIGATDVGGKVIAAAQGVLIGADVSQRPWFINAFHERYVGDVHDAKLLAAKLPHTNGEPARFVDIAFPYRDSAGKVAGILGAHINWAWADEMQRAALARNGLQGIAESLIVDAEGTVILGPKGTLGTKLDLATIAAARDDVARWPDGGSYLSGRAATRGFQSYPGLGWIVIVRQRSDSVLAPARQLAQQIVWSGLGVALVCLIFGLAMPRRLGTREPI